MTWFAWRQFRLQILVVLGLLMAAALFFVLTGPHFAHQYGALQSCKLHGDCESLKSSLLSEYGKFFPYVQALSVIMPAMLGVFWGAPLVARELEAGTYRLAWTQGVTRARWVSTKLAVGFGASIVAMALFSWMLTWWASPVDTINASRFTASVFDTSYIAPIGYAAFGFAMGVSVGVLWRRTVPAMATTLVAFIAVRLSFDHLVRPRMIAPLKQVISLKRLGNIGFERTPSGVSFVSGETSRPNALVFNTAVVGNHGGEVTQPWLRSHCRSLLELNTAPPSKGVHVKNGIRPEAFTHCINQITASFHEVLTYQPANRFWTFQWFEMSIYLVLSALLGAFSYWWVCRRIA